MEKKSNIEWKITLFLPQLTNEKNENELARLKTSWK